MVSPDQLPTIQFSICHELLQVLDHEGILCCLGTLEHSKVAAHKEGNGQLFIDTSLSLAGVDLSMDNEVSSLDLT